MSEWDLLDEARRAEKAQALRYRSLAARAEAAGAAELAQRFHDLHADEQHHLSRLTARLLELGGRPADLTGVHGDLVPLDAWEEPVEAGERGEIERYSALLERPLDPSTLELLAEILEVEKRHRENLGGKWTMA